MGEVGGAGLPQRHGDNRDFLGVFVLGANKKAPILAGLFIDL